MGCTPSHPLREVASLAQQTGQSRIVATSTILESEAEDALTGWEWTAASGAIQVSKGIACFEYEYHKPVLQVFLSSTFTDTKVERDALIKRVFPAVREVCHKLGMEFRVVDMRWGVRDESTRDHLTTELCAQQIAKCLKASCGLNFFSLMNQKYGFRPLPRVILSTEFALILDGAITVSAAAANLLQGVYRENTNREPQVVELVSSDSLAPLVESYLHSISSTAPASRTTTTVYQNLSAVFRECVAASALSEDRKHTLCQSVTEDEIRRGMLVTSSDGKYSNLENVVWFCRTFADKAPSELNAQSGNPTNVDLKFFDVDPEGGSFLMEEYNLVCRLRDEMKSALHDHSGNIVEFDVPWDPEEGVTDVATNKNARPEHKQYLDRFCEQATRVLCDSATRAAAVQKEHEAHELVLEVAHHAAVGVLKGSQVAGRESEVQALVRYVTRPASTQRAGANASANAPILVLLGLSGSGKTSLLAKSVHMFTNQAVVLRFIGTSPHSSHIQDLLHYLCWQLSTILGPPGRVAKQYRNKKPGNKKQTTHNNSTDGEDDSNLGAWLAPPPSARGYRQLVDSFHSLLAKVAVPQHLDKAVGQGVTVVLDSFDQLSDQDKGRSEPTWIPTDLFGSVRMIISCATDGAFGPTCVDELKRRGLVGTPGCSVVELAVLTTQEQNDIINSMLHTTRHCFLTGPFSANLHQAQKASLLSSCAQCPTPLYLSLAVAEASEWKGYASSSFSTSLPASVPELISVFFTRLEVRHGFLLVSHALRAIAASRSGLSSAEIEDILSINDDVLNDVYQYWEPPVRRLPPMLWLRVLGDLGERIVERMADGRAVLVWYHRQFAEAAVARYFGGLDPAISETSAQQPGEQQMSIAQRWRETRTYLADYFEGIWADTPKPYKDKASSSSRMALRMVPRQPLVFEDRGSTSLSRQLNLRRLSELVYQCVLSGNIKRATQHACSLAYVDAKVEAGMLRDVLQELVMLEQSCMAHQKRQQQQQQQQSSQDIRQLRDHVACFLSFVSRNQHVLDRAGPSSRWQVLCQQALNERDSSPVFAQARDVTRKMSLAPNAPKFIFLDWTNKPQHADVCEATMDAGCGSMVRCCAISASGELVVSGSADGILRMWYVASASLAFTLREHTGEVSACTFVQVGGHEFLVSASFDHAVFVWSTEHRHPIARLAGCTDGATCVCAKPAGAHGNEVLIACGSFDKVVRVWRTACNENLTQPPVVAAQLQLRGHTSSITGVCCATIDKRDLLLSASRDGSVRLWSLDSGVCVSKVDVHDGGCMCIASTVLQSNVLVATGASNGTISLWDANAIATQQPAKLLDITAAHNDGVQCLTWGNGGNVLISGGDYNDRCVRAWTFDVSKQPASVTHSVALTGHSSRVYGVAIGPNNALAASAGWDHTLRLWNLQAALSSEFAPSHHSAEITCLQCDPTTDTLISATTDGSVKFWSLEAPNSLQLLQSHTHPEGRIVTCMLIRDEGNVVVGFDDGMIGVCPTVASATPMQFVNAHQGRLWSLCDCKFLKNRFITTGGDGGVLMHDISDLQRAPQAFVRHTTAVTGCDFTNLPSPGKAAQPTLVSCSGNGVVCVWNVTTRQCQHQLQCGNGGVWSIAFAPSSELFACACHDRRVRVFNAVTGQLVHTLGGMLAQVTCCRFLNSETIAAAGRGKTVKVWDLQTGECIANLNGHTSGVRDLTVVEALDNDTRLPHFALATVSADQTLRVWRVDKQSGSHGLGPIDPNTGSVSLAVSAAQIFCGDFASCGVCPTAKLLVCGSRDGKLVVLDGVM